MRRLIIIAPEPSRRWQILNVNAQSWHTFLARPTFSSHGKYKIVYEVFKSLALNIRTSQTRTGNFQLYCSISHQLW